MIFECKIPELGENVQSGVVASVMVQVGDFVEKEQPLVELETEKAVLDVPAEQSGVIKQIQIKNGDTVKVGQVIVLMEEAEGKRPDHQERPQPEIKPVEKVAAPIEKPTVNNGVPQEITVPDLGENIEKGTVADILVKIGDQVNKDQGIIELETDKAVIEVPSTAQGTVTEIRTAKGEVIKVGQVILVLAGDAPSRQISTAAVDISKSEPPTPSPAVLESQTPAITPSVAPPPTIPMPQTDLGKKPAAAAPSVRRFAREIGVDIHQVPGSGIGGRISIDDVKAFSRQLHSGSVTLRDATAASAAAAILPLPDFSRWGQIERERMNPVREKTADHLLRAWQQIPHVTQFDKADVTELENLRRQYGGKVEQAGGKLTMTSIMLKVVASALKVFPQFNASVDMAAKEVILKKYIHIGVAVDTPRGLLVPVIRDADQKNLIQISIELTELSKKARERKLSLDDMAGGNFTISNLGGIGGSFFTPLINAPEVAILGISRAVTEPIYRETQFEPRLMLPLSLSYDHRLIDGADG
ncbi:MAG: dihydrolipoyllysine-residue acetyltransferase, partial [Calditrichaeota bacterium]